MARMQVGATATLLVLLTAGPVAAQVGGAAPPPALFPTAEIARPLERTDDSRPAVYAAPQTLGDGRGPATATSIQLSPPAAAAPARLPLRAPTKDGANATPRSGLGWANVLAALAVVLGLFFTAAWVLRRGAAKPERLLPKEAVEMFGRLPLPGRQQGHLLRVGNKIVLASFSTGGADVLAEITDPVEVDRLAGICRQDDPHGATGSFRSVVEQFFREKPNRKVETSRAAEDDDA